MSTIKQYLDGLRADKEVKQAALQSLRDQRDALIAQHEQFITQERVLAEQIYAAQQALAPILNELADARREAVK